MLYACIVFYRELYPICTYISISLQCNIIRVLGSIMFEHKSMSSSYRLQPGDIRYIKHNAPQCSFVILMYLTPVFYLSQGASGRVGEQSRGGGAGDQCGGPDGGKLCPQEKGLSSLQRPRIPTRQVRDRCCENITKVTFGSINYVENK